MAFKKKLHTCRPRLEAEQFAARVTKAVVRPVAADPRSIERGVRQSLADKISDNTAGLWLLIPGDREALMDGKAIPILSPGQRARIPDGWLQNVHRRGT